MVALILCLRLPFLNQAIQGDDVYYLAGAQHAQIDPLHPSQARYLFLGDWVDMRGHPHPPFNVWFLALLLAASGDIREVPFHAAYLLFSLIAALSMLSLARRFSPRPLWATLLFLATPAFVINGNSLESDLPFLAFWMAGVALFVAGSGWAIVPLVLAALSAYQAVFLTPILGVFVWMHHRRSLRLWMLALAPPVTIALWQGYELWSTGRLPAAVLGGHFQTYGFQALENKLHNALALGVHALWLVSPVLLVGAWRKRLRPDAFLAAWIALFFSGALVVFFAGSARYLLPMAAPVALLVSHLPAPWLAAGFALHLPLSLALAVVNYQHWDGYRQFANSLREQVSHRRVRINGEWGLRYYFEAEGGLAIERGQAVRPGEMVVSSELAYPTPFTTGGGALTRIAEREIRPALPLRIFGLKTRSAYSTYVNGYWPLDISSGPVDRVWADLVVERKPTLEYLSLTAPEAAQQIVSGIYPDRWTGARAAILLKSPAGAKRLRVRFFIHDRAPARRVTLLVDGAEAASQTYPGPGSYTLESPPRQPAGASATLTVVVDKTFSVAGDRRELGVILMEAGFR
ncbi:MAG: hypothetical protein HYR60_01570 [Acidobacteria bacterium]|nr:hypothetical protein [Acidobacteriota bacterium]